ncbi:replication initiator protein [Peromfec virus RodF8_38]|uniref:Replication initiator protein n=1 Tax=Peromfec virus RodF8_38 TaxID=2929373 RepID=A0A976R7A0_9VIRU|nr:replication initiator protein [Peromfec virus RodF8_38]
MCLFPLPNLQVNGLAFRKGVTEFSCGACPECMQKRSSMHALTAVYESRAHAHNCMITLTYDTFVRDSKGNIVYSNGKPLENPVDPDLKVNKRDVQLFVKRLRRYISYHYPNNEKIKYRICAEYGSRTHRAHYHALIFGFDFPDRHFYKKSSRGNPIYMSDVLTKLWTHGICTVDSISVRSSVARYCSKYMAKSRSDETFMLSSQSIGIDELYKDFNGKSYIIDGRQYPVPRLVWQRYIMDKYRPYGFDMSPKYVNKFNGDIPNFKAYKKAVLRRSVYRAVRDSDPIYSQYLDYWKFHGEVYSSLRPSVLTRINLLPDNKYHFYKVAARKCLSERSFAPVFAPGSNCVSAYYRHYEYRCRELGIIPFDYKSLAPLTCLNRASDTKFKVYQTRSDAFMYPVGDKYLKLKLVKDVPPKFIQEDLQLTLDI